MPKNRQKRGRKSNKTSTDSTIINSHKSTGSITNVVRSDLTSKKQNMQLIARPPRNFFTQTFWSEFSFDTNLAINSITVGEFNIAFVASAFSGASAMLGVFDQYCIYSVVATYALIQSADTAVRIYTALDYDSTSNIGKSGIQAYSTFNATLLNSTDSLVRFVKPCIAPTVSNTTPLDQSAMVARSWLDSAYPSIPHYGLRTVIDIGSTSITTAITVSYTAVMGFRNSI
jgi:hypothetical protein